MEFKVFSDVLCTWSYGQEKVLRAIDYIYYGKIEFFNIMGGMFADYKDLLPMNMKDLDTGEMANNIVWEMWKTGYTIHKMPVMDHAPKLFTKDLRSPYEIDKAFVAARLTDREKSNKYLRLLREYTLLDDKNTFNRDIQIEIAEKVEIDIDKFIENLENNSEEAFLEDRMAAFDNRFKNFPDIIFRDKNGKLCQRKGYKTLEEFMEIIDENEELPKREIILNEETALDFINKYERVFIPELIELFKNEEEVIKIIESLKNKGNVNIEKAGFGKVITCK